MYEEFKDEDKHHDKWLQGVTKNEIRKAALVLSI